MRSTRTRISRLARLAAVTAVGAVVLTGCSALESITGAGEPERNDAGEITEEGDASAFSITVGDCLNVSELGTEVETVPTVPCDQPHEAEVYAATDLPDGDFPGDDAVLTAADEFCLPEFEAFVGMAYDDSELYYMPFTPTQGSWDGMNDREILCLVEDPSGEATGSLQGAAR